MTFTMGTGPFGHRPAGVFSVDLPRDGFVYTEPFLRRVRAELDGATVVDSRRTQLVWEPRRLPRYAFPRDDVDVELLGDAVTAAGDVAVLAGHVEVAWNAVDRWLEEDQETVGHPRDPYHRVDAVPTTRHVRIMLDGVVLADSTQTRVIFETSLPPRWYFLREDVAAELIPSDLTTVCAYKGHARYWSVETPAGAQENIAWTYDAPLHDAAIIAGYVAFFDERVEVEVDGERVERPQTPWSAPDWWRASGA